MPSAAPQHTAVPGALEAQPCGSPTRHSLCPPALLVPALGAGSTRVRYERVMKPPIAQPRFLIIIFILSAPFALFTQGTLTTCSLVVAPWAIPGHTPLLFPCPPLPLNLSSVSKLSRAGLIPAVRRAHQAGGSILSKTFASGHALFRATFFL